MIKYLSGLLAVGLLVSLTIALLKSSTKNPPIPTCDTAVNPAPLPPHSTEDLDGLWQ